MTTALRRARILLGVCAFLALGVLPASASAKTELHFFARDVSVHLTSSAGQALGADTAPARGDRFVVEQVLFSGNHVSHTDMVVGHARLACEILTMDRARCEGRIVLSDGTLLANHVIVRDFTASTLRVEINGGSGAFAGAHGFGRSVSVTDSTDDLTVVLRS